MELVIKSITPAIVQMNIEEVERYMLEVNEKYSNWVVIESEIKTATEERAKLNKLGKNIAEIRKRIEKEGMSNIKSIIDTLKTAEKDTKSLSENINSQIKEFEEKEWESKQEEISGIVDNVFSENPDLKTYIITNDKWKNKTMTLSKIELEVEEQFDILEKKYNFINFQLNAVNEEIENKLVFKDVQYLMNTEYDDIIKKLVDKKNEIKTTEDNIKKRAEEEKKKALEELEKRKEIEKQEAVKKARIETTQQEKEIDKENTNEDKKVFENQKHFDTTIRFENAPLSFLKELKALSDKYKIKYQLLENIEL